MAGRRLPFCRRIPVLPGLAVLAFLLVFAVALVATLPPEAAVSPLRRALETRGFVLAGGDARILPPFSLAISKTSIARQGGEPVPLDSLRIGWEPSGLPAWLPGHVRIVKGASVVDLRTSPAPWNPSRVRLSLEGLQGEELAPLLPIGEGVAFAVRKAEIRWSISGGAPAGTGTAELDMLRIPVPAEGSPVHEALLSNVSLRLAVRGEDLHITSLAGTYEDTRVDGTGVISRFLTPSRATITFHLRIVNPLEGRVARMFDMLSKNARNANLRVTGPLLSPAGEFQLF